MPQAFNLTSANRGKQIYSTAGHTRSFGKVQNPEVMESVHHDRQSGSMRDVVVMDVERMKGGQCD